jgi:hypothetical protein
MEKALYQMQYIIIIIIIEETQLSTTVPSMGTRWVQILETYKLLLRLIQN